MVEVIIAILGLILFPLLAGILFAICIGGPLYLLMKGTELFFYFVLNPIIAEIRKIDYIGPILCFIITICIGLPLAVMIIALIWIPVLAIIAHAISFGGI